MADAKSRIDSITSVDKASFDNETDRRNALAEARALCRRLETPMETIVRLCWVEPSTMVAARVCQQVDMFAKLTEDSNSPKTADQLAQSTSMDPALAGTVDFIKETGPDTYAPNELTKALAMPVVNGGLDFLFDVFLPPLTKLQDYLAENGYKNPLGVPGAFQYATGEEIPMFAWYGARPKKLQGFQNHMAGYTSARPGWLDIYDATELVGSYDASKGDAVLVDVGGGYGQDVERFLSRYPTASGRLILQDQEHVLANATKNDKIEKLPYDFYTEQPIKGARTYYMHSIMHDYDDPTCLKILAQLKPAMTKGYSTLLINDNVIPPTGANAAATSMDLIMLCCMGAMERKEEQWKSLLDAAGFKIVKFHRGEAIESVIEAELA